MTTRLTLTIEKDVIVHAKSYASKRGRTLSDMIENYLKILVQKSRTENDLSPHVKKLLGAVKAPKNFDYKKELGKALRKKHSG